MAFNDNGTVAMGTLLIRFTNHQRSSAFICGSHDFASGA
jgi:hypothetical protein